MSDIPDKLPWNRFVVKPSYEGFSIGLKVFDTEDRDVAIQHIGSLLEIFRHGVLIEEFVPGREFSCAVIRGLETVGVTEVELPSKHSVVDLYSKQNNKVNRKPVKEGDIHYEGLVRDSLKLMACFKELDYASFDFRVSDKGESYLIDINPDATLHPKEPFRKVLEPPVLTMMTLYQLSSLPYAKSGKSN